MQEKENGSGRSTQHAKKPLSKQDVLSDRKQQLHLYSDGWQDSTCCLKPLPFQFCSVNTDSKFNTSIKSPDYTFINGCFEAVSKRSAWQQ